MKNVPIGVRLNNPGNLEWNPANKWQGMIPRERSMYASSGTKQQKRFCQFESPVWGIRAMAALLINYQDKYGIRTVSAAINRWAPQNENNTGAYISAVQQVVGAELVDMHDYKYLRPLVEAIIKHENGVGPLKNANTWYDADTIDEGLRLAGVRPSQKTVAKVPVTKETVGATATGAVGAVELVDTLPGVVAAVKSSEDHLTSGDWLRILIGLLLVGSAVVIAYGQVKKHKSGAL